MSQKKPEWGVLFKRAQSGDAASYRDFLYSVRPYLYRFLKNHISDPELCDDLYQNILLRIHVSRHTYDDRFSFKSWLIAIARNVLNTHLRQHYRWKEFFTLVEEPAEGSTESGDSEVMGNLKDALNSLSDKEREALELSQLEDLSMEEAANRAGTTVGAFKVRVHRATKNVKKNLRSSNDS